MESKSKKIIDFIKSLFLPRKMVKHMNMSFFLSLVILLIASCLNIVTSNIRAGEDAEKMIQFPSMYEELPEDFVLYSLTDKTKKMPALSVQAGSEGYTSLTTETNGVYQNLYTNSEGKSIDITVVVAKDVDVIKEDAPKHIDFFEIEGYFQQEKKENTEYVLYVLTHDRIYYLFNMDQINEEGKSTKAMSNALIFETNSNTGELKYYLPKDQTELSLNEYGDFDTTKWTRLVSATDELDFKATNEAYEQLKAESKIGDLEYGTYEKMISETKPVTRHLKEVDSALHPCVVQYFSLTNNGLNFSNLSKSVKAFQTEFKNALVVYEAGNLKTNALIFSAVINLFFPLFLSAITWLMSRSFYMNKFRQYYAICSLCFAMTTIIALIAGFFVNYLELMFPLLIIGSVYYIVATFRINTLQNDDENKDDNEDKDNKSNKKEPIRYAKISDDTTIIG